MEQLTAQIAASYIGCHVTDKYADGKTYKIVAVSEYDGNLQVATEGNDTDWWNISPLKLVLAQLADITDDIVTIVAKLAIQSPDLQIEDDEIDTDIIHRDNEKIVIDVNCRCFEGTVYIFYHGAVRVTMSGDDSVYPTDNYGKIQDTLRGLGVDLGYLHIPSLIAAGVAVSK